MKPHSQKFLQQRRFWMALPLLVLPFVTMIFWALGGGQGTPVQAQEVKSGLNLELPGAHFDKEDELWDKFTLYEQAKRDSLKYEEARRNDPYYVIGTLKGRAKDSISQPDNKLNASLGHKDKYVPIDEQEKMIEQKLRQLTQQLDEPVSPMQTESNVTTPESESTGSDEQLGSDVDRLEKMMQLMADTDMNAPEMQQIEGLIDKILDLQHPERVRERIKSQYPEQKQEVFSVATAKRDNKISVVEGQSLYSEAADNELPISSYRVQVATNGFYGLDDEMSVGEETGNAIEAVIHDTQTIVAGSTIKLRLLSDVTINGRVMQKDQFIYGTCSINGERLLITINSIRDENALLPVSLTVHDLDGLAGIYIPGAITRDAAKQASDGALQNIDFMTFDTSLGAQAASTGIEAAKGLFSKKAKLIKVTVKAGYQVLLRDTNTSNL